MRRRSIRSDFCKAVMSCLDVSTALERTSCVDEVARRVDMDESRLWGNLALKKVLFASQHT